MTPVTPGRAASYPRARFAGVASLLGVLICFAGAAHGADTGVIAGTVSNAATRSNFLIVDEPKNVTIYNVEKRKVVRQVPHRDGGVSTYIFPAKEGHIMVMEYNRKAKETRLSIEALQ